MVKVAWGGTLGMKSSLGVLRSVLYGMFLLEWCVLVIWLLTVGFGALE